MLYTVHDHANPGLGWWLYPLAGPEPPNTPEGGRHVTASACFVPQSVLVTFGFFGDDAALLIGRRPLHSGRALAHQDVRWA